MATIPTWWMPNRSATLGGGPGKPLATATPWNPQYKQQVSQIPGAEIERRLGGMRDWEQERTRLADWNKANPNAQKTWDQWAQMLALGYGQKLGLTTAPLPQNPIPANWMQVLAGTAPPQTASKPKVAAGITLPSWWNNRNTLPRKT